MTNAADDKAMERAQLQLQQELFSQRCMDLATIHD